MPKTTPVKKGIITVAGLGTRFLPATKTVPKCLLPVLDKPVIHHIVEEMAGSGIEEVILVISPGSQAIKDYFKPNHALDRVLRETKKTEFIRPLNDLLRKVRFRFAVQSRPLGNGHALLQAKKFVGNEPFAFSDGDSIIDSRMPVLGQLIKVYQEFGQSVIGVQKITDKKEMMHYGNVFGKELKGDTRQDKVYLVEKFLEKPALKDVSPQGLIVGGMRYIFTPDIWPILKSQKPSRSGEIWLSEAADSLAQVRPFYAYQYEGQYFDTGNKVSMLKTAIHFAKKEKLL